MISLGQNHWKTSFRAGFIALAPRVKLKAGSVKMMGALFANGQGSQGNIVKVPSTGADPAFNFIKFLFCWVA